MDITNYECAICLSLLHKPAVNSCGHVFCYLCLHHAMNPADPSQCPLCRESYKHFPSICEPLNSFIRTAFTINAKHRDEDIRVEEEKQKILTPVIQDDHFVGRIQLVKNTLLLGCHPRVGEQSPFLIIAKEKKILSNIFNYTTQNIFQDLVIEKFKCEGCHKTKSDFTVPPCGHLHCKRCLKKKSCQNKNCSIRFPSPPPKTCKMINEIISKYFGKIQEEEEEEEEEEQKEEEVEGKKEVEFVHVGVGCDSCGEYPIFGKRFRCKTCLTLNPVGFDLCQSCYDKEVHKHSNIGRFNKTHMPDHEMEEFTDFTVLHELMKQHPDLTPTQIFNWLVTQYQSNEDEDDEDDDDEEEEEEEGAH